MKKFFSLILGMAVLSTATFADGGSGTSSVTAAELAKSADARLQLVTLAETGAQKATPDQVRSLVESYRIDRSNAFMPLSEAPYPRFLINAQLATIYPALYQQAFDDFLNKIPLELLLDGVLQMVIDDKVTPDLKEQLSGLDKRMARRAMKGKNDGCKIDESEKIVKVSKAALIALKIDIIGAISPCAYRQRIFNSAKASLLKAREDPKTKEAVKEAAKDKFPEEFRKGFLEKINATIDSFPELVQKKFGSGSATHPIWSALGSIVEADATAPVRDGRRVIQLKSFAQGLLADLFAANVLIKSNVARDHALAAGLFYAVVNRWLLLTGGIEADWDSQKKEMPVAEMGTGMTPPKFKENAFGGWGAESEGFAISMSAWDWGGYAPSDAKKPTALRIFPTRFEVDAHGVATIGNSSEAYQTNDDLAYMLLAVSEFLKATQPGMPLAKFFGGKDQIGDLLDETKPMLFPTEGRMIAVGVLSAVAQNLLNPTIGHIASKRDGIPIYFRDHGTFGKLQETEVDTRGVCSLLVAAAKLTKTLKGDPIMKTEPSLKTILPQISQLVQVSALVVGKEQGYDGSMPEKMASTDKTTSLGAQIAAVRLFLAAFNGSETPANATFVMARLVPAMTYLFTNQISNPGSLDLEARLNVLAVWNQSQSALRSTRPDLPWAAWEREIRKVSAL